MISLYLGIREVWLVLHGWHPVHSNNLVQFSLNLSLDLWISDHVQNCPGQRGAGRLRAGQEKVVANADELVDAER